MKTAIAAIFLLFTVNLSAQYQPIYKDTSTYFKITMEVFDAAYGGVELRLDGDSVVNNLTYKKVYFYNSIRDLVGLMREDSLGSKAWFYGRNDSEERLIMDLDLNVGDTFDISSQFFYYTGEDLAIVDSVTTWNGRRVITFSGNFGGGFISQRLKFIEGVGPNASLMYLTNEQFNLALLTCEKYENEVPVFKYFPDLNDCLQGGGAVDELSERNLFDIFPNPFSNEITIKGNSGNSLIQFQMYDINGKRLFNSQVLANTIIDLAGLSSGIYFYSLQHRSSYNTGKLIKE